MSLSVHPTRHPGPQVDTLP